MKKLFSVLTIALLFSFNNVFSQVVTIPAGASPYPDLAAAFVAINAGGPYAGVAVTVTIGASEVLAAPVITGAVAGSSFTSLLIRPFGLITIGGGFNEALIVLSDADFVTIDGLNTAGNSLTLDNTGAGTATGSIRMSNGSSNNIVKNLTCQGLGVTTTVGGRTINIGQSAAAFGNNDNIIENNVVIGGRRGIQVFGTAALITNNGTIIRNNKIKNASSLGIFIGSETRDNTVTGNEVFDDAPVSKGAGLNYRGINCQGAGVNIIAKNRVHDLTSSDASTTYFGMLIIPVLPTSGPVVGNVVNVVNNSVTLMTSDGSAQTIGIDVSNIDLDYIGNIYYNTFRVGGTSSEPGGVYTAALLADNIQPGSAVNILNNIAINGRTGGVDSATAHVGCDLTAYPNAGIVLNSDYNMCKGIGATATSWDGGYNLFFYSNGIDQYKDTTCGASIEQHTMFRNVNFLGANDSHLGLVGGDMNGKSIAAITEDIDGDPRHTAFPYKGCDEKLAPLRVLDLGGCLEGKVTNSGQVKVVLRTPGCVRTDSCTADLNTGSDQALLTFGDAVGAGPWWLDVVSLNHVETYSAAPVAFGGAFVVYNFKPATATAFGGNLTAAGPPHCFYAGDKNQDGSVDLTDIVDVFNDAKVFLIGCRLRSDMNSDNLVDLTDIIMTFNNSKIFVAVITPCPEPNSIMGSETDAKVSDRKFELEYNKVTVSH